jgi:uncharacterized membrane-anchored protein
MAGEIAGHALNHIYPHRSGRVIVALMMCLVATSMLQGASRRLPMMTFWSAAFLLSLLGIVLAEATDVSMGVGDIGAALFIAILLTFSFLICSRLTGNLPGPMDGSNVRGFFWATAMLAQTVASACAEGAPPPDVKAVIYGDARSGQSDILTAGPSPLSRPALEGVWQWR